MRIAMLLLLFIPLFSQSQELAENKVDEFTKNSIRRTSWETLVEKAGLTLYFRTSKINNSHYFDIKVILGGKVFAIDEDDELMFKLANDSIVSLKNMHYSLSCKGCGAKGFVGSATEGVETTYFIDDKELLQLQTSALSKIRLYTTKGYTEGEVKEKKQSLVQNSLKLID